MMRRRGIATLAAAAWFLLGTGQLPGLPQYYSAFASNYPESSLVGEYACMICHKVVGGGTRNPYGLDLRAANIGVNPANALVSIESFDSDDDGIPNIDEIDAGTPPGRASAEALADVLLGVRGIRDGDLNEDLRADAADIVFTVIPPFRRHRPSDAVSFCVPRARGGWVGG